MSIFRSALPHFHILSLIIIQLLVGVNLLFSGCKKVEEPLTPKAETAAPEPEKNVPYLVSAKLIGSYAPAQIQNRFGNNASQIGLLTKYPVKVYQIVYNTLDINQHPMQASGALVVPVTPTPLPILSQQHGTITNDKSAPSYYNADSEVWTFGTVMASTGYIVAAPDYIGYGLSNTLPHPYEHAASLASASLDMLRASREFCKTNNVLLNDSLFLAGYSEGGYATMALHKLIEEKHADEFTVTASAPGAGAYNKTAFAKNILVTDKPLEFINSYLWVLQTYNSVYKLNRPMNFFLKEPYASKISSQGIDASVSKNPKELFADNFKDGVLSNKDAQMMAAFKDNDIYDWQPKAPVALFHGTNDDFVPFFNSQNAYDAMQAKGAAQVELKPIPGGNHFTSIAPYTLQTYLFFGSIQKQRSEAEQKN